jgi:tetratricopeptide (TPR) repeat protein
MSKIFLLPILLCVLLTGGVANSSTKKNDAARAKARYYYMAANAARMNNNLAEANEYYTMAQLADSTYAEAAYECALWNAVMSDKAPDSLTLLNMRKFVDMYPDDYYPSKNYADLMARINPTEAVRVYNRMIQLFPSRTENLTYLAEGYMALDSLDRAIETIEKYEREEGVTNESMLTRFSYIMAHGDTVRALGEMDKYVAADPNDIIRPVVKGYVYSYLNKPDSAYVCFKQAERIDSLAYAPKLALAEYYKSKGDSLMYDEMVYDVLLSEDLEASDKVELLGEYLATLLADKSSTERGDNLFAVLKKQYPYDSDVLRLSAEYHIAKGEEKEAVEDLNYLADMMPDDSNVWLRLMSVQAALSLYSDVEATYHRAEKYVTPDDMMQMLLAGCYMLDGKPQKSIELCDQALNTLLPGINVNDTISNLPKIDARQSDLKKRVSSVLNTLGDAYYQVNDTITAYRVYDAALVYNPENALVLNNYAYFLAINGGDLDKADKMSYTSIRLDPDNPTYLDTYAWILFKKRDYEQAKAYMEKAIEKLASDEEATAEIYSHYGDILFMNGDPDKALTYWEKAATLDPNDELLQRKIKNKTYFYK